MIGCNDDFAIVFGALKQSALFGSPGALPGPTRSGCIFLVASFARKKARAKDKIVGSDFEFANANPKGERHGGCS
jgi:hypothetical protein